MPFHRFNSIISAYFYLMTCEHCVGAESLFDQKGARKSLKKYRKKGGDKITKKLIKGLLEHKNGAQSILDIGGGIGAVHIELLESGLNKATDVDASSGYINCAKELAEEKGRKEQINHHYGDFLDLKDQIDQHDLVSLDKVICCYPDMRELVNESAMRAKELIAFSYPKSNWATKQVMKLMNLMMWFKKNPFRVRCHSNAEVQALVESHGFDRVSRGYSFPMIIEVYKRSAQ